MTERRISCSHQWQSQQLVKLRGTSSHNFEEAIEAVQVGEPKVGCHVILLHPGYPKKNRVNLNATVLKVTLGQ